jgi:hypothetical protein
MSEKSSTEDLSNIPMADEEVEVDSDERNNLSTPRSNVGNDNLSLSPPMSLVDHDLSQEEQEEKARLIAQVNPRILFFIMCRNYMG